MRSWQAGVLLVGSLGVVTAGILWRARSEPVAPKLAPAADARSGAASLAAPGDRPAERAPGAARARPPAGDAPLAAPAQATQPAGAARPLGPDIRAPWPVPAVSHTAGLGPGTTAEPEVPVRLAFRALWYLGVDPEAEKTWLRAINDPRLPPEVRSDLIVDMVDEGYTDNSHPGKEDLPLILARLEILERYAPHAMDDVNRAAFEQAYRTLLDLYVRLGGKPRPGRRRGPCRARARAPARA